MAPQKTAEQLDVIENLPRAVKELVDKGAFEDWQNEVLNPSLPMSRNDAVNHRNKLMESLVLFGGGNRQQVPSLFRCRHPSEPILDIVIFW